MGERLVIYGILGLSLVLVLGRQRRVVFDEFEELLRVVFVILMSLYFILQLDLLKNFKQRSDMMKFLYQKGSFCCLKDRFWVW